MGCECLIHASTQKTACECAAPGYCRRHDCDKNEHLHTLCRTRGDYFSLMESGGFPCPGKGSAHPFGLGDLVYYAVKLATFGLFQPGPQCGCHARRARLNRFLTLWPIRWPWGRR